MTDYQTLFNIAVSTIGALIGYVIHSLFLSLRDLKDDCASNHTSITGVQILLPTLYANKNETKEMGDRIFMAIRDLKNEQETTLARIENKIDQKMDKSH